jgi:Kef-type K+ transport system membrane component KefB
VELGLIIFQLGFLILFGLLAAFILKKFGIPAVLGLIIAGIALGFFNILEYFNLSGDFSALKLVITDLALAWIGFNIGNEIDLKLIKSKGRDFGLILFGEAFGAFFIILLSVYLLTGNFIVSFILGGIGMATAPASTSQVLGEYNAKGELSQTILFVLALDDLFAILMVNVALAFTAHLSFSGFELFVLIVNDFFSEIFISIVLGFGGALLFNLFGRIKVLEEDKAFEWLLAISFGIVGLTMAIGGSTILTMFLFGIVIKILEPKKEGTKNYILEAESFMIPVVLLFFILIGMEMDLTLITEEIGNIFSNFNFSILSSSVLIITLFYFSARFVGKAGGSWLAGVFSNFPPKVKNNLPISLITQAGVAIGLAGLAFNELTSVGRANDASLVLTVVTISVIISEIIGPLLVKKAIFRAGETNFYD